MGRKKRLLKSKRLYQKSVKIRIDGQKIIIHFKIDVCPVLNKFFIRVTDNRGTDWTKKHYPPVLKCSSRNLVKQKKQALNIMLDMMRKLGGLYGDSRRD